MHRNPRDIQVVPHRLRSAADGLWMATRTSEHTLGVEMLVQLADLLDILADAVSNGVDYAKTHDSENLIATSIRNFSTDLVAIMVEPEDSVPQAD